MTIDDELARWREWPGPRDEPEGAGEPWARDEDRVDELDDDEAEHDS